MAKYKVHLIDGKKGGDAEIDLKDKEAVRRLFQNHGFWYEGTFYAANAIRSIVPVDEDGE